jgi:hypothetical protein
MRVRSNERITPVKSLQEFFKNSVDKAMDRQGVSADEHTAFYVVNLLTLFARSESFFDETENGLEIKPVAKVLAETIDCERADVRNHALQRVGDVSLFLAGFMAESLARRLVDVDYYIFMGGTAYGQLSASVRGSIRGEAFAGVFAELADKFPGFVDVLADVRDTASGTELDTLRIYEIWRRTGSKRAERMLRARGIEPTRGGAGNAAH